MELLTSCIVRFFATHNIGVKRSNCELDATNLRLKCQWYNFVWKWEFSCRFSYVSVCVCSYASNECSSIVLVTHNLKQCLVCWCYFLGGEIKCVGMFLAFAIFHRHDTQCIVWVASHIVYYWKLFAFFCPSLFSFSPLPMTLAAAAETAAADLIFPLHLLQYQMEMIALHALFRLTLAEWKWNSHVIEIFVTSTTITTKATTKRMKFHGSSSLCIHVHRMSWQNG